MGYTQYLVINGLEDKVMQNHVQSLMRIPIVCHLAF